MLLLLGSGSILWGSEAQDAPQPPHRQADLTVELQLFLQVPPDVLSVEQVAEHPDLLLLPVHCGVARGQRTTPTNVPQLSPDLLQAARRRPVALSHHPASSLVEVEPVPPDQLLETPGQRRRTLQPDAMLDQDTPRPPDLPGGRCHLPFCFLLHVVMVTLLGWVFGRQPGSVCSSLWFFRVKVAGMFRRAGDMFGFLRSSPFCLRVRTTIFNIPGSNSHRPALGPLCSAGVPRRFCRFFTSCVGRPSQEDGGGGFAVSVCRGLQSVAFLLEPVMDSWAEQRGWSGGSDGEPAVPGGGEPGAEGWWNPGGEGLQDPLRLPQQSSELPSGRRPVMENHPVHGELLRVCSAGRDLLFRSLGAAASS